MSSTRLKELYLGKNKIAKMENLHVCPELSLVDLQNCRILEIEGLEGLPNLTSLHLAHNGITEIKNLKKNTDLDTIDLSGNPIKTLGGLEGLDQLEDLWMNDCKIEDWKEVEKLERIEIFSFHDLFETIQMTRFF